MTGFGDSSPYTGWGSAPTGAAYRVSVVGETAVEPIPGLDANALAGRLSGEGTEVTGATLCRDRSPGIGTGHVRAAGALLSTGLALFGSTAIFESTPLTIDAAHSTGELVPAIVRDGAAWADPAAYRAFKDIVQWLDADDGRVADMVGIGRTTPYTWKRDGREPRAATAQSIYEHHATLDALRRRLGEDGLRGWLHEGVPTRREVILAGRVQGLERDIHEVLFYRPVDQQLDLAAAPEAATPGVPSSIGEAARPSHRRPRRPAR